MEKEGVITLLGADGEDGGRMHGMEENEVRSPVEHKFRSCSNDPLGDRGLHDVFA